MEKNFFRIIKLGRSLYRRERTITEADIVLFSAFTGTGMSLHTNVEYAARPPSRTDRHGMLGLVTGMALLFRLGPYVCSEEFHRFLRDGRRPLHRARQIGDTIHCEMTITACRKRREEGIVESPERNQKPERETTISTSRSSLRPEASLTEKTKRSGFYDEESRIVAVAQSAVLNRRTTSNDQAYRVTRNAWTSRLTGTTWGQSCRPRRISSTAASPAANAYYWETTGPSCKNASRQDGESLSPSCMAAMRIHFRAV